MLTRALKRKEGLRETCLGGGEDEEGLGRVHFVESDPQPNLFELPRKGISIKTTLIGKRRKKVGKGRGDWGSRRNRVESIHPWKSANVGKELAN